MKFHSLCLTALTALTLSLSGCSNDDAVKAPDGDTDGTKITLTIGVASGPAGALSRADEVGYDEGLTGEKAVKNAMLIIYDRPINSTDKDAIIVKTVKFSFDESEQSGSSSTETAVYYDPAYYPQSGVINTIKVGNVRVSTSYSKTISIEDNDDLEIGQRYYATAVCNLSQDEYNKISALEGESLQELRDYVYSSELYKKGINIKSYTDFCMTGINEISFLWDRDMKLDKLLVQRLTARLDVMLGSNVKTETEEKELLTFYDGVIKLAVYSDENGKLEIKYNDENKEENKYFFYLTDLKIINDVDPVNNGTYLLERSSVKAPSTGAVPVYFDNEGWETDGSVKYANASKFVYSYSTSPRTLLNDYSLSEKYSTLYALISEGTFHGTATGNKNNSSIVGYLTENTNSSTRYTTLIIEGYTDAGTSAIFKAKSRAEEDEEDNRPSYIPDGYNKVIGEIPIRHSLNPNSDLMRYAVVRNTIYRVRIKVVARDNKIYFRYYYANGSNQDPENLKEYESGFANEVYDWSGSGDIKD